MESQPRFGEHWVVTLKLPAVSCDGMPFNKRKQKKQGGMH